MKTLKKAFIALSICGMIVFWTSQAIGEDWTAEQKEVWAAVQAGWEALKNGDVKAATAGQHDKMLAWWIRRPDPMNKELIQLGYKSWISQAKPNYVKLEPLAINIVNNVANAFYLFKWQSSNKEVFQRGRALLTLVRQDDKWLAIGSLSSSCDRPAPCPYDW